MINLFGFLSKLLNNRLVLTKGRKVYRKRTSSLVDTACRKAIELVILGFFVLVFSVKFCYGFNIVFDNINYFNLSESTFIQDLEIY